MKGHTKALIYYFLIYFSTEIPFRMGYAPSGPYSNPQGTDIYALLSFVSFVLVLLYHTIPVNLLILGAALVELSLIVLNILCVLNIDLAQIVHGEVTGVLNIIALLFLIGNWLNGAFLGSNVFSEKLRFVDWYVRSGYTSVLSMFKRLDSD